MNFTSLALFSLASLLAACLWESESSFPRLDYAKMLELHSPQKRYPAHDAVSLGEAAIRIWRNTVSAFPA